MRRLPFSPVSCWITGGSHSRTPSTALTPIQPSSDPRRASRSGPSLAQRPREPERGEPAQSPLARPAYEMWVCRQKLAAKTRTGKGAKSSHQTDQTAMRNVNHQITGQVRVPRLREDVRAVEREQQRQCGADAEEHRGATPAAGHPEREEHGDDVQRRGRRLQRPGARRRTAWTAARAPRSSAGPDGCPACRATRCVRAGRRAADRC